MGNRVSKQKGTKWTGFSGGAGPAAERAGAGGGARCRAGVQGRGGDRLRAGHNARHVHELHPWRVGHGLAVTNLLLMNDCECRLVCSWLVVSHWSRMSGAGLTYQGFKGKSKTLRSSRPQWSTQASATAAWHAES